VKFSFLRNVAFKGLVIFLMLTVIIGDIPASSLGQLSIYNHLVPGRPRFPFGETPQRSYNLSLYNLEAMFQSHEIEGEANSGKDYRVIVLGDSSVWGTLLKPEETLTGRLNALSLQQCGKPVRFFNLGYPTISLTKDVLILQRALQEKPDLVIWVTTLEAFPVNKQYASPLAENNRALVEPILGGSGKAAEEPVSFWGTTLFGRRREFADWARLQLYGIPWAATRVDQDYPDHFTPADIDLEADDTYYDLKPGSDLKSALSWNVLQKGMDLAARSGIPVLLVNEPILISNGENSQIRYNFYYPRWVYDAYRTNLQELTDSSDWPYLDAWDLIPMDQFTNSAIHLTPKAEANLAAVIGGKLTCIPCDKK